MTDENDSDNDHEYSATAIETYYSNLGRPHHGIIFMGKTRRKIISAFQWISNIIFFVNGIIALVDICMSPSAPEYYLYLNKDAATAAGFPFAGSHIGWIPYAVLQACSLGFVVTAAFLELRCYSVKAIGLDIKWSIYAYYAYDEKMLLKSLNRAQVSFSPYGNCYDNYFYITPLYHLVILLILFLHLSKDFDILSFTPLITVFAFILFVILFIFMVKLYFFPLSEIERLRKLKRIQDKMRKEVTREEIEEADE